ncbi:Protein involved in cell division [Phocoenobacter uteri]|uniref:protein adenylyltransferase n=1 Tax=Phocoenobacter uteri TaxID=146806 RepID=A0A379DF86_9PAST|nr:IncP plasmid survival protein KfrC family protein [Phocoenobacter uteri]MDG6882835.1 hypothetical protein [Phocoenobacter uteri]SUB76420.1 Protein involved in cell division [Phocoenobacter uteri]
MSNQLNKAIIALIKTSTNADNTSTLDDILNAETLKNIHKSIFNSNKYYFPGNLRINDEQIRSRNIESENRSYTVFYYKGVVTEDVINNVLNDFKNNCSNSEIEKSLSALYSSLDHLHPFEDGNSRTIREFTRQVADKLGYELDWSKTNITDNSREELYKSRDLEVISISFPNLNKDSLKFAGRDEYAAYESLSFLKNNSISLESVFKNILHPHTNILAAKIDKEENSLGENVILKSSLNKNLDETQKTVYEAMEAERQQNYLIENQYTDSLTSVINEKNEQVKRLETKLSKLVSEATSQVNRLQSNKPSFFSMPSRKNKWNNIINAQKHIINVATRRLEAVHEIRDDMGLHSSKIENMAKKKLHFRDPCLVNKYKDIMEINRIKKIQEAKNNKNLKHQKEISHKAVNSLTNTLSVKK